MRVGENAIRADWRAPVWNSGMTKSKPVTPDAATFPDLTDADDRSLVEAFRAGRRDAFDVIVVRHRRQVYQLCYRFVNNHEDAADLAQDVFVRAFKGLGEFQGRCVARDVAVSRGCEREPESRVVEEARERAAGRGGRYRHASDAVRWMKCLRGERADAVRRAIAKLPPKQRATVLLRVYQDCSHEEIAVALGSTVGAVKANFFHALGNLRRVLKTS